MKAAARAVSALVFVVAGLAGAGSGAAATAKTPQTITVINHAPATAGYAEAFQVTATASSGLPVEFGSSGPCTRSGTIFQGATFTMTSGTGTCLIQFDQPGDATYDPAPQVVESVTAHKIDQSVQFDPVDDVTFGDPDFEIAAVATSGLDVAFSASGKCTVSGAMVHLTGAGSCTLTASQAGDANFNAAVPVSRTFGIAKADQQITFFPISDRPFGDPDFKVSAEADSGLPVSFTARGSCTVRGRVVHMARPGSCTITASQAGSADYNAAKTVSQSFAIVRANCAVPKLVGKKLRAAKRALVVNHCRAGRVRYVPSSKRKRGRVLAQSKRPGRVLRAGAKIRLVVGSGPRR